MTECGYRKCAKGPAWMRLHRAGPTAPGIGAETCLVPLTIATATWVEGRPTAIEM
jgi:hypothetical protein